MHDFYKRVINMLMSLTEQFFYLNDIHIVFKTSRPVKISKATFFMQVNIEGMHEDKYIDPWTKIYVIQDVAKKLHFTEDHNCARNTEPFNYLSLAAHLNEAMAEA